MSDSSNKLHPGIRTLIELLVDEVVKRRQDRAAVAACAITPPSDGERSARIHILPVQHRPAD